MGTTSMLATLPIFFFPISIPLPDINSLLGLYMWQVLSLFKPHQTHYPERKLGMIRSLLLSTKPLSQKLLLRHCTSLGLSFFIHNSRELHLRSSFSPSTWPLNSISVDFCLHAYSTQGRYFLLPSFHLPVMNYLIWLWLWDVEGRRRNDMKCISLTTSYTTSSLPA